MKSKTSIILISIVIVLLVIVLALLVNHLVLKDGDAHPTLVKIDALAVDVYNSITSAVKSAFNYIKYLHKKITAVETLEYPENQLPHYPGSTVTDYDFDSKTNTLNITTGTSNSFDSICNYYYTLFTENIEVSYLKQYQFDDEYTAYGVVGNFVFLLEAKPSNVKKYMYSINTQLHYLVGDELNAENFFRQQNGTNSYVFTNPYIYMYQEAGDTDYIYLQLRDYKSQLLNIDTHVELFIDDEFFSSRYYGDTIRIPIQELSTVKDIKMISLDNNNCIRAVDILDNLLCYDAAGKNDFYDLASEFSNAKNLFITNTESIEDILYFQYFTHLESLYLEGNDIIDDYSPLLDLLDVKRLYLNGVNSGIIHELNQLGQIDVLEISNSSLDIRLGEDFKHLSGHELYINDCPNLTFADGGVFSNNLELIHLENDYNIGNLNFVYSYPNLRMISIEGCDKMSTLLNTANLINLNMLKVKDCVNFDLSQPLENMHSLMNLSFISNTNLAQHSDEYIP